MSSERARAIVDRLMSDAEQYRQALERENDHWGRVLTVEGRAAALEKDRAASVELRLHRDWLSLPQTLKRLGANPKVGLSLGCGSGRAERGLLTRGVCQRFHGVDVSAGALEEARRIAAEKSLPCTYEQADLNEVRLEPATYDLVVAQTSLHHVLRLEHVADEIHESLTADGLLWIHDFIGESQRQWRDERLEIANAILAALPEDMRSNTVTQKVITRFERPDPDKLGSPFESIRSAEIVPVFLERFDLVASAEVDSLLHLVCDVGTRSAFAANEDRRALFELLFFFDRWLIRNGVLSPLQGMYLLRPKR